MCSSSIAHTSSSSMSAVGARCGRKISMSGSSLACQRVGRAAVTTDTRSASTRGLDTREIAHHKEHVDEPECKPDRPDEGKPHGEENQARIQEQQAGPEQPEAIASIGSPMPLRL